MPVPPPPGSKKVFEGILASVYQWPQKMYDGSTRTFECYVREDTVGIIPFVDRETILLTYQEQPHLNEPFWDVPGGRVDPGETLEEAAVREFREETRYRSERFELWEAYEHKTMTRFTEGLYIATHLVPDDSANVEAEGERIKLVEMKWPKVIDLCFRQQIRRRDAMLAILAMQYDPEAKARLKKFLEA